MVYLANMRREQCSVASLMLTNLQFRQQNDLFHRRTDPSQSARDVQTLLVHHYRKNEPIRVSQVHFLKSHVWICMAEQRPHAFRIHQSRLRIYFCQSSVFAMHEIPILLFFPTIKNLRFFVNNSRKTCSSFVSYRNCHSIGFSIYGSWIKTKSFVWKI